jgi:hypothetical protein
MTSFCPTSADSLHRWVGPDPVFRQKDDLPVISPLGISPRVSNVSPVISPLGISPRVPDDLPVISPLGISPRVPDDLPVISPLGISPASMDTPPIVVNPDYTFIARFLRALATFS